MQSKIESGEITFNADESGIVRKIYLDTLEGRAAESLLLATEVGVTRDAAAEIKELFDGVQLFDTPKPTKLIERILWIAGVETGDVVLDFFAGSSTTADAVLRANARDGQNRSFIVVQIAEALEPSSEAAKAGYSNIAEISRERIRRAGRRIASGEVNARWDGNVGFRALVVASSNLNEVRRAPDEIRQDELDLQIESIKPGRSSEDLLFQVLLDWGLTLDLQIETEGSLEEQVFVVNCGELVACFAQTITPQILNAVAGLKPLRAVFRDSAFTTDADRINAEQVFKDRSPGTDLRTL